MTKPPSKKDQPENLPDRQAKYSHTGLPRRVSVKGTEGANATVVVTVVQGKVWMSISPPFTWEAIMEPLKVDELMHVLELAREDAKKMAAARSERAPRADKTGVRSITGGPVPQSEIGL